MNLYTCHESLGKISHTRVECRCYVGLGTEIFGWNLKEDKNLGESWGDIQEGYEFIYYAVSLANLHDFFYSTTVLAINYCSL